MTKVKAIQPIIVEQELLASSWLKEHHMKIEKMNMTNMAKLVRPNHRASQLLIQQWFKGTEENI